MLRVIYSGLLFVFFLIIFASACNKDFPNKVVYQTALQAMQKHNANVKKNKYIVIIDYDLTILQKRLWLIDIQTQKTILHTRVSHAWKSGFLKARTFSNTPGSNQSSTGSFVAAEAYYGQFGYAMRIDGLEENNNQARKRAIVFHAHYWPWSQGCFMTSEKTNQNIINRIKNGTFIYVHHAN